MEMNDTQREIEHTIRTLCTGMRPFVTVSDIAEHVSFSERTVLNNADAVVRRREDIIKETVGKANVFYVKRNRLDDVSDPERTRGSAQLMNTAGDAGYVTLDTTEDSRFDLEARWYDWNANEIDGYRPTTEEIGSAAEMFGTEDVSIKYWDPEEVDFEDKPMTKMEDEE